MKHTIALGCALAVAWLLWSGIYDSKLLFGLGLLSCLLVLFIVRRMGLVDKEGVPLEITARLPLYAIWLAWEVFKANLDVAKRILSPSLPIKPKLIHVKAGQKTELGRVIYANSITLTPGTVTVEINEDEFVVHALTDEAGDGVEAGDMDRKVCWLEGSN